MCNVFLCVVLPPVWDKEDYEEATKRFKDQLVTAHRNYCVWKGSRAPDWFLGLPKRTYEDWLQDFRERYCSLAQLHDDVPVIHDDALSHLEMLDGEVIKSLLALVPHNEMDADVTSCILALYGWEARAMSGMPHDHTLIVCSTCKRKILLSSLVVMSDLMPNKTTRQEASKSNPIEMVLEVESGRPGNACNSEMVIADNNVDKNDASSAVVLGSEESGIGQTPGDKAIGEDGEEQDGRETVYVNQWVESEIIESSQQLITPDLERLSKPQPESLVSGLFEVERLPFDVMSQHCPWCPWIKTPSLENVSETRVLSSCQPGWKALGDLLCSENQLSKTSCQQVRCLIS
jgi:hypothetical protein